RLDQRSEALEDAGPTALVRPHGLLVPQPAVGEADLGRAVDLLEVDLDQRPPGVAVPDPGEREPVRRVDLGVLAAAAVLGVLLGVVHDDAHVAADAQVDLRLALPPALLDAPPAAHHLRAGPSVEDRRDRRLVGALDPHGALGVDHRSVSCL